MKDGFKTMKNDHAVMMIKGLTGVDYAPGELLWAEYSEESKILQYEDELETIWQLDCQTGQRKRQVRMGSGFKWMEWSRGQDGEGTR